MNLSLAIEDWCQIFSEQASTSSHVFWVRSIDYKQQVFLGSAFSSVWGISQDVLYNTPTAFSDFIISDNKDLLAANYVKRHHQQDTGVSLYKIKSGAGKTKYIRDRFMTLCDHNGKAFAAAGVAMDISDQMDVAPLAHESAYDACADKLKNKLNILINSQGPITVELTLREKQCARLLKQGFTALQTAKALCLSRRTVEKHIEGLKYKFNCATKMDLLRLLIEESHHINLK